MQRLTRSTVAFLALAVLTVAGPGLSQTVSTTAGTGTPGFSGDNGAATVAQIDTVYGVAVDARGDTYLADSRNHRIRKIANGVITTVAGTGTEGFSGDGAAATSARLSFPRDVAVDALGNVYIADTGNCRIRKVTPFGTISTVAGTGTPEFSGDGGPAASAALNYPAGVAVDAAGNLYIADSWNYRVRKIGSDGKIQTVIGNGSYGPFGDGGPAVSASLGLIQSLAVDAQGSLYLSDSYNHRVRKVAPNGTISTVVGGGFGPAADGGAAQTANLRFPKGIAVDAQGNLYVADSLNHRIRKVSPEGTISTAAGTGTAGFSGDSGAPTAAQLNNPHGVGTGPGGALFFSDLWNYRVRNLGFSAVSPAIVAVTNAAGGQHGVTAGGFASIWGSNLAPRTMNWDNAIVNRQLPTSLEGVSVTVGGKPAYIHFVSSTQINILVPQVSAGPVQVQVTNGGSASAPFNATAYPYSPAFFLWGEYAVASHAADYSFCSKPGLFAGVTTTPAKPGEWIVLWANGFGPTNAPWGVLTPAGPTYPTAATTVTIGGVEAPIYGGTAVLTPNFAGLYQMGVQVPASTPDGDVKVRATIGGVQTPDNVFIRVQR